jgi:hypothetical protein
MVNSLDTMTHFISAVTIRARAAFYLAIAESLFSVIKQEDEGYPQARKSIDMCWMWVEGKSVKADTIYEHFTNEDDVDVLSTASAIEDPVKSPAWNCVVTALYYVIWQVYKAEGEKYLPADVDEVNEEIIYDHLANAKKSKNFHEHQFENLKEYLLENYPIDVVNPLGKLIRKSTIINMIKY